MQGYVFGSCRHCSALLLGWFIRDSIINTCLVGIVTSISSSLRTWARSHSLYLLYWLVELSGYYFTPPHWRYIVVDSCLLLHLREFPIEICGLNVDAWCKWLHWVLILFILVKELILRGCSRCIQEVLSLTEAVLARRRIAVLAASWTVLVCDLLCM
jgi:hypothetical protein